MKKIFLILAILAVLAPFFHSIALGAGYTITTSIPGTDIKAGQSAKTYTIVSYIAKIYEGALAIVGLIALVMIVWWGFVYTISAGNSSKISDAKEGILQAIWGLALLLSAYMILRTINPALVNLDALNARLTDPSQAVVPDLPPPQR